MDKPVTANEQIAALQEQRREINRRIKELRNEGDTVIGSLRLAKQVPPGQKWTLAYEVPLFHSGGRRQTTQFRTLYFGDTRGECIDAIPGIINELREFYDAVKAEGGNFY